MTDEQLITELRRIKHTPTMSEVARRAGVGRMSLYRATASGRVSKRVADALKRAVQPVSMQGYQNARSQASIPGRLKGIP